MKIKKWTIGVLMMIGLLAGSLGAGALPVGRPDKAAAAPAAQTDPCANDNDSAEAVDTADADNVEEEVQCGPQDENEADETGGVEDAVVDTGDETAPANLAVTAVQARTIAENANPGAATLAVEFDRENGQDIWEVELDNGQDVKVDADSGQILLTEARD